MLYGRLFCSLVKLGGTDGTVIGLSLTHERGDPEAQKFCQAMFELPSGRNISKTDIVVSERVVTFIVDNNRYGFFISPEDGDQLDTLFKNLKKKMTKIHDLKDSRRPGVKFILESVCYGGQRFPLVPIP